MKTWYTLLLRNLLAHCKHTDIPSHFSVIARAGSVGNALFVWNLDLA